MIYAYPMDNAGCGSYRIKWPAEEARKKGLDVITVYPGEDAGLSARINTNTGAVKGMVIPDDCETVVLQRPTNQTQAETVPFLKEAGVRVVVDIDDDLAAISPRHPGWAVLHKTTDTDQSWDAVIEACKQADVVVASTPALAERYGYGHGVVVRNRLPDHFFEAELKEPDSPHVGWAGAIISHPDDLSVIGSALAQLRCDVRIVGPPPITFDPKTRKPYEDYARVRRLLGTDKATFAGSIEFDCWIPAVSQLYVAMAPLEVSRFNVAKSWLKPLEYAVAKVPFVATDIDEYRALGAGLFASKSKDWRYHLKSLLNSETLRQEEIERNWEIANSQRISSHVDEWIEAWVG